jgi:hypothetical protein
VQIGADPADLALELALPDRVPSSRAGAGRLPSITSRSAGRIPYYTLMPGGSLDGLSVARVTASANGAEVAVTTFPPGPVNSSVSADVIVINTRTGARAVWHGSPAVRGTWP